MSIFKNCCCLCRVESKEEAAVSPCKLSENYEFDDTYIPRGKINGISVPFFCTPEFRAEVRANFKLRPNSDVFIVTYPKSGTTWTQKIVRELLFRGDAKPYSDMILSDRLPWVDSPMEFKFDVVKDLPSPRVFKSHNQSLEEMDEYVLKGDRTPKFIYVMRDPKDVAVSLYCHLRGTGLTDFMTNASFDEFLKQYMRNGDEVYYGLWEKHVENWLSKRNELNMLVLMYENMKANPRKEIERIGNFLGLDLTEAQIEDVAEKTTIEYMKKEANVIADDSGQTSSILRKGKVGDWKNYFVDQEEAEKLTNIAQGLYYKHGLSQVRPSYTEL